MTVVTTLIPLDLRKQEFVPYILLLPSIIPLSCPGGSVSFSLLCFQCYFTGLQKQSYYHLVLILSRSPQEHRNFPCKFLILVGLLPVLPTVPHSWTPVIGQKICCDSLCIFISRPCDTYITVCIHAKTLQSCPTLCNPVDRLLCLWGPSCQEYWSVLSFPPPGDLSNPGNELTSLMSPVWAGRFLTTGTTTYICIITFIHFTEVKFLPSLLT